MRELSFWQRWRPKTGRDFAGLIIFVLFSPLIVAAFTFRLLRGLGLHLVIWLVWGARGQHVLFVYSNSPNWQDYIEQQILPRLPHNVAVLNWSERQKWRWSSLAVQAFYFFGGMSDYVPLAVIFRFGRCNFKFEISNLISLISRLRSSFRWSRRSSGEKNS